MFAYALLTALHLGGVLAAPSRRAYSPKLVLIDTDLFNVPDDVGALAVANVLQTWGEGKVIGIASSISSRYAPPAIDAINTYYDHPDIPVAQNKPVTNLTSDPTFETPDYISLLANCSFFPEDIKDGTNTTEPLKLYRKLLSESPDYSVTFAIIGFMGNIAELYHSGPDEYSRLKGRDLIERKIRLTVVQGGQFDNNPSELGYNLERNVMAARVLEDWPGRVVFLGNEVGTAIQSGEGLKNTPITNPVREAYDIFLPFIKKSADSSWDQLTVYFAFRGIQEGSFKYGDPGRIKIIDNKTVEWDESVFLPYDRQQHFLRLNTYNTTLAAKLEEIMNYIPLKRRVDYEDETR